MLALLLALRDKMNFVAPGLKMPQHRSRSAASRVVEIHSYLIIGSMASLDCSVQTANPPSACEV
jgi:hypothetical protein